MHNLQKNIFLLANERLVAYTSSSNLSDNEIVTSRAKGNIQELINKIKKDEDIYRAYHPFVSTWSGEKK